MNFGFFLLFLWKHLCGDVVLFLAWSLWVKYGIAIIPAIIQRVKYGNQEWSIYDVMRQGIFHFVLTAKRYTRKNFTMDPLDFKGIPSDVKYSLVMMRLKDVERVFDLKAAYGQQFFRARAFGWISAVVKRHFVLKIMEDIMDAKVTFIFFPLYLLLLFNIPFMIGGECSIYVYQGKLP